MPATINEFDCATGQWNRRDLTAEEEQANQLLREHTQKQHAARTDALTAKQAAIAAIKEAAATNPLAAQIAAAMGW